MNAWLYLQRMIPVAGMAFNSLRYPGLRTALRVEIRSAGHFHYGAHVRVGEGSRIDVSADSCLTLQDNVIIGRYAYLSLVGGARQRIGEATSIQDHCRILGTVSIGQGCIFAPNVFVSSGAHSFDRIPHLPIREQERLAPVPDRPVRIFDDCWLGVNAVVQPGVTIGRGCVVGANSVVTHDLPPYTVAAGAPAQIVRNRLAFVPKSRIEADRAEDAPYFYDGFELSSPDSSGVMARKDFILALYREGARGVRLCVSGAGGEISHHGRHEILHSEPRIAQFAFPADAMPFLRFGNSGTCRVCWAELV